MVHWQTCSTTSAQPRSDLQRWTCSWIHKKSRVRTHTGHSDSLGLYKTSRGSNDQQRLHYEWWGGHIKNWMEKTSDLGYPKSQKSKIHPWKCSIWASGVFIKLLVSTHQKLYKWCTEKISQKQFQCFLSCLEWYRSWTIVSGKFLWTFLYHCVNKGCPIFVKS